MTCLVNLVCPCMLVFIMYEYVHKCICIYIYMNICIKVSFLKSPVAAVEKGAINIYIYR
jgi:hypothetical protein